ncbi:putative tail tubular protein B [uncultured Mediterranean phage]|nr:putative tail tubular protein B [uncultured Mediterranean phage]
MARVHPFQTNFTAGELTSKLAGQVDFKKYNNGVETMENMTVFPQGGTSRRFGSRFVGEVKNSANATRLIPFEFNVTQSYILEFGNLYIRFYKDNGQIVEASKTISGLTAANPGVVTATSHGYSNGDHVWINSVVGMTEVNGRRFTVANKTTNTFELSGVDTSGYTAYSSAGTAEKVYEIATSFTSAQVFDLKFTQSADVMYITHPSHEPTKLTRTGHSAWTIAEVDFQIGPFLDANTTATTLTTSATTVGTGRTLTASATTGINGGDGFQTTDVGRLVKLGDGWGKITARTNTTVVTWTINVAATGSGTTAWSLGAWSDTDGFPSAVSFYEQRLVFAGSTNYPQTIWASESGAYEDFDAGDADPADAFIYTIAANRVNVIRWLAPARDLIVGTAGGEFRVGRPTGEPLKPDNVTITQQTTYGGHTTQPIQVGSAVLFVQRQKRKVREFAYRFEDDAYVAPDMTLLAEHITGDGIDDVDFAQEPESIYWAVREDGVLLGMTYQREEDVVAWHRHLFGGTDQNCTITVSDYTNIQTGTTLKFTKSDGTTVTFTSTTGTAGTDEFKNETNNNTTADNIFTAINTHADFTVANPAAAIVTVFETTPAGTGLLTVESSDTVRLTTTNEKVSKVKSVATISETLENQVWLVVERIINGSTVKYVEYLDSTLNMDSGLSGTVTGSSTTVTALDHLEGETVQILIDDAVYPVQKVSSGAITVSLPSTFASKTVEVGLGYVSTIKTMRVEAGAEAGTAQGRKKRYNEVTVRLYNTVGATVNGDQIPFRTSASPMGQPISSFTGDKRVSNLGWDRDGQVTVQQTQPLPMTILGITGTLVTSD